MRHHIQIKLILFCLLPVLTTSCSSQATEQINPSTTQTPIIQLATPTSTKRFQITYIQNYDNYGELHALDVSCIADDKACFGEPNLLFRTLTIPNNEQNKPKGLLTDYSWSPDGSRIALISAGEIIVGDINTQDWTNITNSSDVDEYQPKWSSDGKHIYYRACPRSLEGNFGGHSACQLYRSDPTGKVELTLFNSKSDYFNSYDVSPNGEKVVFSLTDGDGYDQIYQANLDGSNSRQITEGQINNNSPSFSPDGQKITFVRLDKSASAASSLQSDIFLKDLETGDEENLTKVFDGNVFAPVFSPDGKWAAFSSFDAELSANIFVVSLDQSVVIQVTDTNQAVGPSWRWSLGQ